MEPRESVVAWIAAACVLTALAGCAPPTADNPGPTPTQGPAVELATTTPLPPDRIAATSFIDADRGWAVGEVADGGGSLLQRTTDGGRTWEVLYADGAGFPLQDVVFTDALHGWAVSSSGTLVGFIIATTDGGHSWVEQFGAGPLESVDFTDNLHGVVRRLDGDSPQRPITLTTSDGGETWTIRPR